MATMQSSSSSLIPTNKRVFRFPPLPIGPNDTTFSHDPLILMTTFITMPSPTETKTRGLPPKSGAFWFKDGVEEFIHGSDYLIQSAELPISPIWSMQWVQAMIKAEESGEPRIISPFVTCMKNCVRRPPRRKDHARWMSDQVDAGKPLSKAALSPCPFHPCQIYSSQRQTTNHFRLQDKYRIGLSSKIHATIRTREPLADSMRRMEPAVIGSGRRSQYRTGLPSPPPLKTQPRIQRLLGRRRQCSGA